MSHLVTAEIGDAHDIDVVMPMYNLIENSDIYSKTPAYVYDIRAYGNTIGINQP